MTDEAEQQVTQQWTAHNYCVTFIDLLGQRDALKNQSLLPLITTKEEEEAFHSVVRKSVGTIIRLQDRANAMLAPMLKENPNSPFRAALPPEQHVIWDEMQRTRIKTQFWSDGLLSFVALGEPDLKCRMNGIFGIFSLSGALCLLGLASRSPVRGAIEIAWGIEIQPGNLVGPAVARAYELESEVANYPRVIVGPEMVRFLQAILANPDDDVYSKVEKSLATLCLDMLIQDIDGHWSLHYLGDSFQSAVTEKTHQDLYKKARRFVLDELTEHQKAKNSKLAFRYAHLMDYFEFHSPVNSGTKSSSANGEELMKER